MPRKQIPLFPRKQIPLFELPPNAKSRPRPSKQANSNNAPGERRAGEGFHFSPALIHEAFPPVTQWFEAPVDFPTRVILLGDVLADLNPNKRPGSFFGAGSYRQAGAQAAWNRKQREWKAKAYSAWCDYGHPIYAEKIRLQLTVARNKVVDPDNALAAYKQVIDGMVDKTRPVTDRLVPDDGRNWLEFAPVLFSTGYCHRNDPYTIIDFLPMRLHIENEIARYKRHEEIRQAVASWEDNQWEEWND